MRRALLVCLFQLFCVVVASAQQPPPACTSKVPYGKNASVGRYVTIDGVRIYYEAYGTGPAVLLLHGNGNSILSMACQVEFLSSAHRVIAVDSRGHGNSDDGPGPLTFERQADDFVAVLDAEKVQQADVVGHSDGGILALEMGIRHPARVRKIVAAGPNLRPDATALDERFFERAKKNIAEAEAMLKAGDKSRDWARRKRQIELDYYEPHISLNAVHSITAPTLLIGGDEDIINLEHYVEMYHALQHGQLFIRPGAPHGGLTDPNLGAVFNAAVAKFLDQPFARPTSRR